MVITSCYRGFKRREGGRQHSVVKQRKLISNIYPVTGPSLYGICYVKTERAGQTAERRERSWLGGTHLCSLSPTGIVLLFDVNKEEKPGTDPTIYLCL